MLLRFIASNEMALKNHVDMGEYLPKNSVEKGRGTTDPNKNKLSETQNFEERVTVLKGEKKSEKQC